MKKILLYLLIFNYCSLIEAQSIILKNPSFEGTPAASTTPKGWHDCDPPEQSPPDTQPNVTYRVEKEAYDGKTYIGMVTRSTDTWEAVGQELHRPMEAGSCYDFSLYLARSESYLSVSRTDPISKVQFTQPVRLRIWAGNDYCDKRELLEETSTVEHTDWRPYKFKLKPLRNYDYIMLEAFYVTPTLVPYNGNILIDKCSDIVFASCDDEVFVNRKFNSIKYIEESDKVSSEIKIKTLEDVQQLLNIDSILQGQIISIHNVYQNKSLIFQEDAFEMLDRVYFFLEQVSDAILEIDTYVEKGNDKKYYNKLTEKRALEIGRYLKSKGIDTYRLIVKGDGSEISKKKESREWQNQIIEIKFVGSTNDN